METNSIVAFKPEAKVKNAGTVNWLQECVHKSRNEVFSDTKTITPALADVILATNFDNRRIRIKKLDQMTSDMREGRWSFNGEPIIVAKTGELNDGQHRLLALVAAKVSLPMLFVFGVERDTRTTLDQGATRSPGDFLAMDGVPNSTTLAAVTRYVLSYEGVGKSAIGDYGRISAAKILERAEGDRTLATSAQYAHKIAAKMRKYATPTVIGFCHNVLLNENTMDGMAFMEQLCTGENLQRGDPAFTARERLLSLDTRSTAVRIEIILRAWNGYREQRKMKTIPIHGRLPELV